MRRILIATALVAGLVILAIGHATGQSAPGPLWATVNSCGQNQVGMRASLPGDGSNGQMQVRFTAQWYSPSRHAWAPVDGVAASPWLDAGSAQYLYRQAGWTFEFDQPTGGSQFQVRGVAEMQWLEGGRVVRSVTRVTQAGAVGVVAGDGGSRATCTLG